MPGAGHVSVKNITSVGWPLGGVSVKNPALGGEWKHVEANIDLSTRKNSHFLCASPFSGCSHHYQYAVALVNEWAKTPLEASERALGTKCQSRCQWSVSLSIVLGV